MLHSVGLAAAKMRREIADVYHDGGSGLGCNRRDCSDGCPLQPSFTPASVADNLARTSSVVDNRSDVTNSTSDSGCVERMALVWGFTGLDRQNIHVFLEISERMVPAALLHAWVSAPGHDGDSAKLASFERRLPSIRTSALRINKVGITIKA